jgi:hypothetical protein
MQFCVEFSEYPGLHTVSHLRTPAAEHPPMQFGSHPDADVVVGLGVVVVVDTIGET